MEDDEILEDEVIELHFVRSVSGGDAAAPGESIPYSFTIGLSADPEELALLQDILVQLQDSAERECSADDLQADLYTQELLEETLAVLQEQNLQLQHAFLSLGIFLGLIFGAMIGIGLWLGRLNNK